MPAAHGIDMRRVVLHVVHMRQQKHIDRWEGFYDSDYFLLQTDLFDVRFIPTLSLSLCIRQVSQRTRLSVRVYDVMFLKAL